MQLMTMGTRSSVGPSNGFTRPLAIHTSSSNATLSPTLRLFPVLVLLLLDWIPLSLLLFIRITSAICLIILTSAAAAAVSRERREDETTFLSFSFVVHHWVIKRNLYTHHQLSSSRTVVAVRTYTYTRIVGNVDDDDDEP